MTIMWNTPEAKATAAPEPSPPVERPPRPVAASARTAARVPCLAIGGALATPATARTDVTAPFAASSQDACEGDPEIRATARLVLDEDRRGALRGLQAKISGQAEVQVHCPAGALVLDCKSYRSKRR